MCAEALGRLIRQAVDQVDVDAVEAQFARGGTDRGSFRTAESRWMAACTSGWKSWMPMLRRLKPRRRRVSRCVAVVTRGSISMPISASGENGNARRRSRTNLRFAPGVRYVGVPPPQWNCTTRAFARNVAGYVLDFSFQDFDVGRSARAYLFDNYVAGAEEAQALAEGQMHVEREAVRAFSASVCTDSRSSGPKSPSRPAPWDSWCSAARGDCSG